jgi:hypothetical protein
VNTGEASGRFTAEQLEIVTLPSTARAVVKAAAGTGKTHTLAGRLTWLVENQGLSAGDQVLVLSFSRAAVAELRRRIAGLDGDARYVGAATFDSFATRIISGAGRDASRIAAMDYASRIRAAVDLLSGEATLPDDLQLVQHVLVDEIQDLVGARADLVMALLERARTGFTLFGDPAQAIYDHQEDRLPDAPDLYSRVQHRYPCDVMSLGLTRDYRSLTPQANLVAGVGACLRLPDADQEGAAHQLRSILLSLPTVKVAAARRMLNRRDDEVNAFLTRTNGEALLLSRALFDASVPHRYQRRGEEKAAPDWISKLVAGLPETQLTRAVFDERLAAIPLFPPRDPDVLYGYLKALGPGRGRTIDLQRVADRVREQNLTEDMNAVAPASVVVSTIHRAKGLEFDRVLLTEPVDRQTADVSEENRVMYVALSRARQEIFHVSCPDTTDLRIDQATKRWVRRGFGRFQWQVRQVEVTGQDVDAMEPACTWLLEARPREIQEYLGSVVHPGDPVEFQLEGRRDGESMARYSIRHDDHVIGRTSEGFGQVIGRLVGGRHQTGWPERIEGLHVELVDTVAGDASVGRSYGLGSSGMWLRVRVFGLGSLRFRDGEGTVSV